MQLRFNNTRLGLSLEYEHTVGILGLEKIQLATDYMIITNYLLERIMAKLCPPPAEVD